jgi:hypothetical protein
MANIFWCLRVAAKRVAAASERDDAIVRRRYEIT